MVGGYQGEPGVASRLEFEELGILSAGGKYDREALAVENEGYISPLLADNDDEYDMGDCDDTFDGMIFMSNRQTKKECFKRKLFGLPMSQASAVKQVKPGMILFLFEYEMRQLYGIFEATSGGALNIERNAYKSSRGAFPAQVRFRTVWECHPLSEDLFRDAILENYYTSNKFHFHLSQEQVSRLIYLFSLRRIDGHLVKCTNKYEHGDQQIDEVKNSSKLGRIVECVEDDRLDDSHIVPIDLKHHISCLPRPCCTRELPGTGLPVTCNGHFLAPQHEVSLTNYQPPNSLLPMEPISSNVQEATVLSQGRDCFSGHIICDSSNASKSLTPHSVQVPTVCGGDCWLHVNSDYHDSCARGYDVFEKTFGDTSVSRDFMNNLSVSRDFMNNLARENLVSRENQVCQTQKFKTVEGAMDFSGQAATNGSNSREEMYGTNIGSVHIASNQHHDSFYVNESIGAYGSQSFSSVSGTPSTSVSKNLWSGVCDQLNRVPANNSYFSCCAGGCSLHSGNLGDDFPLNITGQPEYHGMQSGLDDYHSTGMASSSKSDICIKKKSVFARLSMPESKDDHIDILLRRKRLRRLVEHASEKSEKLEPNENVTADEMNRNSDDDRSVINFKRRSQVCKAGNESKPENMSLDYPWPNPQSEGQVRPINDPHKQKRRKLIRPQFDTPNIHLENVFPAHIGKCSSETISEPRETVVSILPVSEKKINTEHLGSSAVLVHAMVDFAAAHDIESKDPPVLCQRQESDKVASMQNKTLKAEGRPPSIIVEKFTIVNAKGGAESKDLPALESRQVSDDSCEKVQSNQAVFHRTNIKHNVDIENQQITDLNATHDFENKDSSVLNTRQGLQIVACMQPLSVVSKTLTAEGSSPSIIAEELTVVNAMDGAESKDLHALESGRISADNCEKVQSSQDVSQSTNIKNNVEIENQQIADLNATHDFENKDSSVLNTRQELQIVACMQPLSVASKTPTTERSSLSIIVEEFTVNTMDGAESKDLPALGSRQVSADSCENVQSNRDVSQSTNIKNNVDIENQQIADLNATHEFENKVSCVLNTRQELQIVATMQPFSVARKTLTAEKSSSSIIVEEFTVVNVMDGAESDDLPALESRQDPQNVASVRPVSAGNKIPIECRGSPGIIFEGLSVSTADDAENKDSLILDSWEASARGGQK